MTRRVRFKGHRESVGFNSFGGWGIYAFCLDRFTSKDELVRRVASRAAHGGTSKIYRRVGRWPLVAGFIVPQMKGIRVVYFRVLCPDGAYLGGFVSPEAAIASIS